MTIHELLKLNGFDRETIAVESYKIGFDASTSHHQNQHAARSGEGMNLYKSVKIGRSKYRVPRSKRRQQLNANDCFCVVNHKNRWIVALTSGRDREFYSCDTLNRTQALNLIQFLSDYVNMVKPTEVTALNASVKIATNRIIKTNKEFTALVSTTKDEGREKV